MKFSGLDGVGIVLLGLAMPATMCAAAQVQYTLGPDSLARDDVPRGRLEGPFDFRSKIFAGTVRQYWIFVPAQYVKETPANLLVFQDGYRATAPQGALRVPAVLENLIHKRELPVTIGVFVTPGHLVSTVGETYPDKLGMNNPNHRSAEYDAMDDRYARFLIDELLPEVSSRFNITSNPERRAIGGTSSGAICAFTVAWHRPDHFRRVISMIGSYTSIGYRPAQGGQQMTPGGNLYPTLIRKNPIRPLRVFFQGGSHDLDNEHGNWFLANQQMVAALKWANADADRQRTPGPRYDVTHVWGEGEHSDQHGGSILPEILRWLFR